MKKLLYILIPFALFASEAKIALDYVKLEDFFVELKKCSDNDFFACENIKKMSNFEDYDNVKSYTNTKCKEKNMSACYFISMLTDDKYIQYNALRLACQNHFELACTELITRFETNSNKGLKILQNQCDKEKNLNSCYATAQYYSGFLDKDNSIKYAEHTCNEGFYSACILLSNFLINNADEKKAHKVLERTCNKGYEPACFHAANVYLKMGNFKLSKKFLEKSCNLKNQTSCKKLEGF